MEAKEYLGHIVYPNGDIFSPKGTLIKKSLNDKGYQQVTVLGYKIVKPLSAVGDFIAQK